MKRSKFITLIVIAIIYIFGLSLRLYRLNINTPPLYADEANTQYYYFNQLTDKTIPFTTKIYRFINFAPLSSTWMFGLNVFGARFSPAINGSLICIGLYLLVVSINNEIKKTNKYITPLLVCLLSAITPWSFMISRIYPHIPLVVFFLCLHLYIFIKSKTIWDDLVSVIPLLISTYFYMSMAAIVPFELLFVFISVLNKSSNRQKKYIVIGSISIALLLGYIFVDKFALFDPNRRGLDLAIWRDANVTADSNLQRGIARYSEPTIFSLNKNTEIVSNKMLFNYPISVVNVFFKNYLSFFSPDFLFLKGDTVMRNSTGMVGQFFPFLIPYIIYGAFVFFKYANRRLKQILLIWILISPIPGALTKDGANYLLRVITLMPFLTYFSGLGIVESVSWFKNRVIKIIYVVCISLIGIYSAYYFYFGYFHVYPSLAAQSFEYGFKEISDFNAVKPGKMLIIWEDKYPVGYFCFWQKLPFSICAPEKTKYSENINNTRIDLPIENLLFSLPQNEIDFDLIISKYKPKYIVIPAKYMDNFPKNEKKSNPIETIKYPDQTTAFSIFKVNN